ncbi:MAG: SH3 domain-containing protein [Cuspidothrix sp.]|jgi:outer membrane biosynthesis protein TonB|uniref:Peptide-binding protein n=1 Tax=Cuspidothrix issatschenkoi CHARLIE-1 TaxID=2052836 RepID=A0A2S6CU35_9CYAN|nr:peptide-binding protein [Cuspidothrix issatschenkoi CHARLIE-1]
MLTNLLKFILGFVLALAVLLGTSLTVALYFVNRTAVSPSKPIFANDNPSSQPKKPKTSPKPQSKKSATPTPKPTPKPTETPTPTPKPTPPNAYTGNITWAEGLSMRSEPNTNSPTIGGVGGNKKVIVLEESDDKKWQKIRIADTDQEGWVKAGNIQRSEQ